MASTTIGDVLTLAGFDGKAEIERNVGLLDAVPVAVPKADVARALGGVLDMPLGDVLFGAWETYSGVQRARTETNGQRGARKQVRIAGHTVRSVHHPKLECELSGKKVFELVLDFNLLLEIEAVVVTVVEGKILEIGPGTAIASTSLKAGRIALIPEQTLKVTLPGATQPPG
jgi:hypothetical protein